MGMIIDSLIHYASENKDLLGYDQVVAKTQKTFSLSNFKLHKKDILEKISKDNFIFAFDFGIIFLRENILFINERGVAEIPYSKARQIGITDKDFLITYFNLTILVGPSAKKKFQDFMRQMPFESVDHDAKPSSFDQAIDKKLVDSNNSVLPTHVKKILDFKNENSDLLDYADVTKLMSKFLSPFNSYSTELLKFLSPENVLCAFKFGLILTEDAIIWLSTKPRGIIKIPYAKILKITNNGDNKGLRLYYEDSQISFFSSVKDGVDSFFKLQELFDEQKFAERSRQEQEQRLQAEQKQKLEEEKIRLEEIEKSRQWEVEKLAIKSDFDENKSISYVEEIDFYSFVQEWYLENYKKYDYLLESDAVKRYLKLRSQEGRLIDQGKIIFGTKMPFIVFSGSKIHIIEAADEVIEFDLSTLYDSANRKLFTFSELLAKKLIKIENGSINRYYDSYLLAKGGRGFWSINLNKKENLLLNVATYVSDKIDYLLRKEQYLTLVRNTHLAEKEVMRKQNLEISQARIISELDTDGDGNVDLIDADAFNQLLIKNQKQIIEIDKVYVQKFVKISTYLKTKKNNIQNIFESIRGTKDAHELKELIGLLKNQINTYELLFFHSINMTTSLIEGDLITFYEIYEAFDQLGVFNSNWENEISSKLTNIGDGIRHLMYSINEMETRIVRSIRNLNYATQESYKELGFKVENQLRSINSTIKFNNLISSIQTFNRFVK